MDSAVDVFEAKRAIAIIFIFALKYPVKFYKKSATL